MKYLLLALASILITGCNDRFVVSGDCYSWKTDHGKVVEKCFRARHEAVNDYKAHIARKENTKSWQDRNWIVDSGGY